MRDIDLKIKFMQLYDKYHSGIYRFLRVKVATNEMAQDLASEAFIKAWDYLSRNPEKYPDNERAYLYKTAYNCMADHYRSAQSNKEFSVGDEDLIEYLDNTGQTRVSDSDMEIDLDS